MCFELSAVVKFGCPGGRKSSGVAGGALAEALLLGDSLGWGFCNGLTLLHRTLPSIPIRRKEVEKNGVTLLIMFAIAWLIHCGWFVLIEGVD